MIQVFLSVVIYFSASLVSYDKIEVASYLQLPVSFNAKALYTYDDIVYVMGEKEVYIHTSTLSYIGSFKLDQKNPAAIARYKENIYILDEASCSITVYNEVGKRLFSFGGCGDRFGQLISPKDLAVFDDKVFVANTGGAAINIYTPDGIFLYSIPTINKDKRYTPSRVVFDPEGYLYIADRRNRLIAKFDFEGRFYGEYPVKDDFPIDITEDGFIYTASEDGKIREYDLNLVQKGIFGTKGKGRYEFAQIRDIRAYKDGIFILDSKNKKIVYLKIEHKERSLYQRKNIFKERLTLIPYTIFKLPVRGFLIKNGMVLFYSNKKGEEGVYSFDGENTKKIISYGKAENQILSVADMIYHKERLYLLDNSNYKVKVFEDGKYLFSFGDKAGLISSTRDGRFSQPIKMTMDSSEKIYILDAKLYLIQVFNKDGVFLYSIDLSRYNSERFVDLLYDGNNIFLLSTKKVFIFAPNGSYLNSFELKEINSASSFCYDGRDNLFIADEKGSRVWVYNKVGKYIAGFFGMGKSDVELYNPSGIRYDNERIYLVDGLDRISSFGLYHFVRPGSFEVFYDTTQAVVSFSFEVDNKSYLKELAVERSLDGKNFVIVNSTEIDTDITPSNTYYYRLKVVSVSGDVRYSDVRSVFIPLTEVPKSTQPIQISHRPPFEIIPINLDYIFASSYKYYLSNPIGKIVIKNNTSDDFENLKLSFFIKEYMDFPYDIVIDSIASGAQKELTINATLNSKIVAITETTPVQARLTLEYYINSEKKEVSLNIPLKILSRNSIIWDDPRRFGSFITIKDPVISDLSKVVASKKDEIASFVDDNVKIFSLIYRYLSEKGIKYVEDPVSPYKLSHSSFVVIDTVQYPRNLLKIKAGDCDDLTALFISLLEASGVESLIVDYNDHITGMFGLKGDDIYNSGIPKEFIVEYEGKYYIPFESTLLGKDTLSSISYAAKYYKNKMDIAKIYRTRDIVSIFEPPTFNEDPFFDTSLPQDVVSKANSDIEMIEKGYFDYYENYYLTILKEDPKNTDYLMHLGVLYGMAKRYDDAKRIFEEILQINPQDSSALNNLANIYHIQGDYSKAALYYEKAYKLDPYDADIFVNAAKNAVKLGKMDDAKILLEKAIQIKPEIKQIEKEILKEER